MEITFDENYLKKIAQVFFPGSKVIEIRKITAGHIHDSFKILVEEGLQISAYLFQRINELVFTNPEDVMYNIKTVSDHLKKRDFDQQILEPYMPGTGKWLFRDENKRVWRVFPYIRNTFSINRVENADQAYFGGSGFGHFLAGISNLPSTSLKITIPRFHDGVYRLGQFQETLKTASTEKLETAKKEIGFILKEKSVFHQVDSLALPGRVCHHDTKINNLLFDRKSGKVVAVIDLDTLMPGHILSDFGDMVRTFTNSAEEDEYEDDLVEMRLEVYKALKEGFMQHAAGFLSEREKENLENGAKWIILMQAMRFLTDYLQGSIYYKTGYPAHNLVRTKNQIALYNSFCRQIS